MNDTEMLDWLAAHCIFPDETDDRYILPQIAVLIPAQYAVGNFTGKPEDNKRALREAIQRARLKELHAKVDR